MLPELIEIKPLAGPVNAVITVPGSKSITNRALILAALGEGKIELRGALWSEDTQIMAAALERLGFHIDVQPDPNDACNRMITVGGRGGAVPAGGTPEAPLDLPVGNAGTAARFLAAFVCLGRGVYRLHGTDRMHQRPQAALFQALRELGYRIDSANDRLPAVIHGAGPRAAACSVSVRESSQFASALLLGAGVGGWKPALSGEEGEEGAYVAMTRRLIEVFPRRGGAFQIEPDTSGASYFCAAGGLLNSQIEIASYPKTDWQIDTAFPRFMPPRGEISRRTDLGDSIMTAIAMAAFGGAPVRFTHLERLRVQECERVAALRSELSRCGVTVLENGETLTVHPSAGHLHGAEIETYQDHRMAMCMAIFGLKVPGIKLKNPSCVKKTFPNFFQKLAAAPPNGLGAVILDPSTGRALGGEALFAD